MDRVAFLSAEAVGCSRRKRSRQGPQQQQHQQQQQRLDAKAAMGKLQRTDTDHGLDEQPPADAGSTQDSVQTTFCQAAAMQQQQQQQQLEAQEDIEGSSSEVEGPVADDKYIKGTRLVINGWFQACRGCNEPTAHTTLIARRDVPLCPRCQSKYLQMINGCFPPSSVMPDACIEPLHYWLPRLLGPVPPLSVQQRRDFCDSLVLRQDDAWGQLIRMS